MILKTNTTVKINVEVVRFYNITAFVLLESHERIIGVNLPSNFKLYLKKSESKIQLRTFAVNLA